MRSRHVLLRVALVASFVVAAVLVPEPASATPNFPGAIQTELMATGSPECAVCHQDGRTGRGTVNTPFGSAMRARGLVAYEAPSLVAALAAMRADRVDSDGDGTLDVDTLKEGGNPNGGASEAEVEGITPTYGCVGQVAPARSESILPALALSFVLFLVLAVRRRAKGAQLLFVGVLAGSVVGCASGASLTPRGARERPAQAPAMAPMRVSEMGADLTRLGLDVRALPRFEQLTPHQVRGVMSTFTRALGAACTDCHDAARAEAPTRMKRVSVRMWNELTRDFTLDGGPLYCDSCHQGQTAFLRRADKGAISGYMSDNYTDHLKRSDKKDVECESCHGSPMNPRFLGTW